MGPFIYGKNSVNIGIGEEFMHCPYCNTDSYTDVHVYATYFHFYWIPFCPMTKEMNTLCQHCGGKRIGVLYKKTMFKNHSALSRSYRHRWYTYIGISLLFTIIALIFLSVLLSALNDRLR